MAKKIAAIFAALILSASILASCAGNNTNETTTTTTANINANQDVNSNSDGENSGENNTEEANEQPITEAPKILPNLNAETDFEKYEFKILTKFYAGGGFANWMPLDVSAEEITGEPLNDAVYKRNTYLEDAYNFKIKQLTTEDMSNDVRKSVSAGDQWFDIAEPAVREGAAMAQSGFLTNLNKVGNLNFEQPWWDHNAVAQLSIGHKLFLTSGDLTTINFDASPGILFNKKLLKELNLSDPYELVLNNTWTLEMLYEMSKGGAKDINGDGVLTWQDDRFGYVSERDGFIALYHGTGERGVIKNKDDDLPVLAFGGERCYTVLDGIFKIMYDTSIALNVHHYEKEIDGDQLKIPMFQENRSLFMWTRLGFVRLLRDSEVDFGILPMPKLNSSQENWGSMVNSFVGNAIVIPNNQTEEQAARTGFILEAICAESMYTTKPAYYEINLKTKFARDVESSAMLDIIFSNMVWDIGDIFSWGIFDPLIDACMKNDTNVASKFEKKIGQIEKSIKASVTKLEKFE